MKILQIINNLTSGGAEKLLCELVSILNERGHDVDVVLLSDKNNVYKNTLLKKKIKITVLGERNYQILHILQIRRIIKENKYDVIHTHLFPSQYFAILACYGLRKSFKLITTEHSTHNKRRELLFFKFIEKFIYNAYGTIICISDGSAFQLEKHVNKREKIKIIHNGINLTAISTAKSSQDSLFNPANKYLIVVGRFVREKRQDIIINALKNVPTNIHLVLVGEGPLLDDMKALSSNLGLTSRTHFLGFRNDVASLIKSSDVVVVPSDWEGFGLVAAEGMAAGKPIIASNIPGLKEVARQAGILFTKGNQEELENAIIKVLSSPLLYEELARKGESRSKQFDVQTMVSEYLKIYQINS